MRLLVVIGFLLLAVLPVPAWADDPEPPHEWYAVPFDGYRHPISSWPHATSSEMISFTIYAAFAAGAFEVEVATSPNADPDGTLADANRVDAYVAPLDPRVTEAVFTGRTNLDSRWLATLGTYYWQAYRRDSGEIVYSTPIQRIIVVERPPPDPPSDPPLARTLPTQSPTTRTPTTSGPVVGPVAKRLSRSSAKTILRRAIRTESGHRPKALTQSCRLTTAYLAHCRLTWRDARYRYRVKARVSSSTGGILAKLDGTRTRRECSRRCSKPIHWSVATSG